MNEMKWNRCNSMESQMGGDKNNNINIIKK